MSEFKSSLKHVIYAVYVLWLREMKRLIRAKSRFISSLAMPLMFLVFLGMGFKGVKFGNINNYVEFLTPGIAGMAVIFSSTFAGLSVLWDREFGFLKEITVAPVSNVAVVCGRIAGSATTSVFQAVSILVLALPLGFSASILAIVASIPIIVLMAIIFTGMGLFFAAVIRDFHGFGLVMNFVIFPLFFLSGAIFPVSNLPGFVMPFVYLNPLFYGIDGMRFLLVGSSFFPLYVDFVACVVFAVVTVFVGAKMFDRI